MIKLEDLLTEVEKEQIEEASLKSIAAGVAMALAGLFPQKVKAQQAAQKPGIVQTAKASDSLEINMGTLFGSGKHTITDKAQLERVLSQVANFMAKNPSADYIIDIKSSESKVPNRDAEKAGTPRVAPGFLAHERATAVDNVLSQFIAAAKKTGAFKGDVKINTEELANQGPEWKPGDNTEDPRFKQHQYVNVNIKAVPKSQPGSNVFKDFGHRGEVWHMVNPKTGSKETKALAFYRSDNAGYRDVLLRVVKRNTALTGNIDQQGVYTANYLIPWDVWNKTVDPSHELKPSDFDTFEKYKVNDKNNYTSQDLTTQKQ